VTVPAPRMRRYEDGDGPALADLWVASWRESGFAIDFEARRLWLAGRLAERRAAGDAIVVGLDAAGRPAGFVTIDPAGGYLDQLCVAPAEKGAGLARLLLAEARRLAPGRVELDVNEGNGRARRFYEREGFVVVGRGESAQSGLPTLRLRWAPG